MFEPALLLKWLHVLSSAVLFGGLFAGTIFVTLAALFLRAALRDVARLAVKASWVAAVALVTQPVTGAMLLKLQEDAPFQPWLVAAYSLYAVLILAFIGEVLLLRRMATSHQARGMAAWAVLAWGKLALMVVLYFLMIAQPAL